MKKQTMMTRQSLKKIHLICTLIVLIDGTKAVNIMIWSDIYSVPNLPSVCEVCFVSGRGPNAK